MSEPSTNTPTNDELREQVKSLQRDVRELKGSVDEVTRVLTTIVNRPEYLEVRRADSSSGARNDNARSMFGTHDRVFGDSKRTTESAAQSQFGTFRFPGQSTDSSTTQFQSQLERTLNSNLPHD